MSKQWDELVRLIRRQVAACDAEADDATLLARFADERDEAAFEQLLRRYGPMVYAVCRRTLPSVADAEDAFQATFLALVGRAKKVRHREAVGGWLHRAALQTASELLRKQRRRIAREVRVARPEAAPTADAANEELLTALDQEVAGLPDRYRQAIVLCRILNKPLAEAAATLGLSAVAVWKRVHRAEDMLRQRLLQRGLATPAAGLGVILAACPASALSPEIVRGVVRSAVGGSTASASGVSATGLSGWVVALVAVAAGVCGAAVLFVVGGERPPANPPPQVAPLAGGTVTRPAVEVPPPLPERPVPWAVLAGRVVDAGGQPVSGAKMAVLGRTWEQHGPGLRDQLLEEWKADADGRFRVPVTTPLRGEHEWVWIVASDDTGRRSVTEVPVAGGLVPKDIAVRLPATGGVSGRVLTADGKPLADAAVRVTGFGRATFEPSRPEHQRLPVADVWPQPVTTDANGRFAFPGLDSTAGLRLVIRHEGEGLVGIHTVDKSKTGTAEKTNLEIQMPRVRKLVGRVTAADTGKPMAKAQVVVSFRLPGHDNVMRLAQTGADGRYAITVPVADRWTVQVAGGPPTPYLTVRRPLDLSPDDDGPVVADVALPRGAVVSGRVTDADTGKPIHMAKVRYVASGVVPDGAVLSPGTTSFADGRFTLAVPPAAGHLLVTAPDLDYVVVEAAGPGGRPFAAHAAVPLTGEAADHAITLSRGRTIQGQVTLPDGSPVADGWVWCYHLLGGRDLQTLRPLAIRDGRFVVTGCRAGRSYTVVLADREFRHGAVVRATLSETPVEVRLELAGAATVEVKGDPMNAGAGAILTASVSLPPDAEGDEAKPAPRWCPLALSGAVVGPDGLANLRGLIPGANYRIALGRDAGDPATFVTVPAGGQRRVVLELPDSGKE